MRTIALEEHFTSPAFLEGPGRQFREFALKTGGAGAAKTFEQLYDVGDERLAKIDAAGVDMQVLSLAPGVEQSVYLNCSCKKQARAQSSERE